MVEEKIRHLSYHKIWTPDKDSGYVVLRYHACRHRLGFCVICESERGRLPFWALMKHRLIRLWEPTL